MSAVGPPHQLPTGPAKERDTQTGHQAGLILGWAPKDPPLSDQTACLALGHCG